MSAHEISDTVTQLLMLMLCIQYIRNKTMLEDFSVGGVLTMPRLILCAHHAHGSHLEGYNRNLG